MFLPGYGRLFPATRPEGRLLINAATYHTATEQSGPANLIQQRWYACPCRKVRADLIMATNPSPLTEVLHSENHSKLSSEEIAKAVARHNKNHSAAKAENASLKAKKVNKK